MCDPLLAVPDERTWGAFADYLTAWYDRTLSIDPPDAVASEHWARLGLVEAIIRVARSMPPDDTVANATQLVWEHPDVATAEAVAEASRMSPDANAIMERAGC